MERAEQVWNKLYPERRPWGQLEESTREEWRRFTQVAIDVYQDSLPKPKPFVYPPDYLKELEDYLNSPEYLTDVNEIIGPRIKGKTETITDTGVHYYD